MFMAGRAIGRWKRKRVESRSRRETVSQASAGAIGLHAVRPTDWTLESQRRVVAMIGRVTVSL